MKKVLVLLTLILITTSYAYSNEGVVQSVNKQSFADIKAQREKAFEKRLGLTEEQKIKAKEIRKQGHDKIKPVIEQIIAKKQEAKMVKMSRIAVQIQEERLDAIDKELKILEKKAHDIRKANMKEFESILTKEQKKILKQMKKEGRKRYQETHPNRLPLSNSVKK